VLRTWVTALVGRVRLLPADRVMLRNLLLLNLALQLFDGLATAYGIGAGVREGNPLLRDAFAFWGVAPSLFVSKSFACGALLFVFKVASDQLAVVSLAALAFIYSCASLVPWLGVLTWLVAHS